MELLILLVEHPGQLVSREEIGSRLWGKGVHVDVDSGVNTAVRKLRAALKDSPDRPAFIETVSGKGYRFIGCISKADPVPATTNSREATPTTIAVMPFQNLSSDPEQDYFADGLTEETIAALGSVSPSRIRVIARTSSMTYKGTRKTAGQIGTELSASYLVESSVRRDSQHVRITATLIRVKDQVRVWNATYDRAASGFLGIQDEIGSAIAGCVGAQLSALTSEHPARKATEDPDAYDLYLRGRYHWYRRTPESMRKSIECFNAAVQKDPSYALPYAGLADAYVIQTLVSGANALDQWDKTRLAVDKALSMDPSLAEAHTAAGMSSFFMSWDWAAAERSFKHAIALNPNYATAHQYYGHLLSNSLRHDEAIAEIHRAQELDPLSPIMHTFAGLYLFEARRYGEALAPLQMAISIDPDFFPAHGILGWLYEQTAKPDAAIEEFRTAYRLSGGNLQQLANQGFVFGRTGRRAEAEQMVNAMGQILQSRFVPPHLFALVYAGLGDRNKTFEWLEKSYEARDIGLVFLTVDPKWDSVRADGRFEPLLRRCRFMV